MVRQDALKELRLDVLAPKHDQTGADSASRRLRFFGHGAQNVPDVFADVDRFSFRCPTDERVGENYITHHTAQIVVTEIKRRIELKIP